MMMIMETIFLRTAMTVSMNNHFDNTFEVQSTDIPCNTDNCIMSKDTSEPQAMK